ncbi:hypothetical protein POM88_028149 [Heracleum sosnowskyi]|uniref:NADP-dependent oxidoreductase domain-containing protein n=1 Tax=Heracleum sosnowskyi TaxID=360622 RepID=A0AAD8MM23_9APIA|nr:hypothetical protein POM88_028149 [Heracleum sosnowskyi]
MRKICQFWDWAVLEITSQDITSAEAVKKAVLEAIELGYRMFDTATLYGIMIAAYSPLGAAGATQVALRWAYEQGIVIVCKSFNKERLKQNLEIFDWELSAEDSKKIAEIPQLRSFGMENFKIILA